MGTTSRRVSPRDLAGEARQGPAERRRRPLDGEVRQTNGLVTDSAVHDGARLREGLIDSKNTASEVWAEASELEQEALQFFGQIDELSSPGE